MKRLLFHGAYIKIFDRFYSEDDKYLLERGYWIDNGIRKAYLEPNWIYRIMDWRLYA